MKDNTFNTDNLIKFKDLSDRIKNISDPEFEKDDFDIDLFRQSGFAELFGQILSEKLSEPYKHATEEELYEEIVDNYFMLIEKLGVDEFNFFRFKSYDYYREIIIDGKEYDLDGEFCHDDSQATEALSAIDCLIADLDDCNQEEIVKNIEKRIYIRNKG